MAAIYHFPSGRVVDSARLSGLAERREAEAEATRAAALLGASRRYDRYSWDLGKWAALRAVRLSEVSKHGRSA